MWDDEIDNAARKLTAGEPGGDLKARVLARIEARGSGGRSSAWIRIAVPVAAAVGIVLGVHEVHEVQGVHGVQGVQRVQEVHRVQEPPVRQDTIARTSNAAKPVSPGYSINSGNIPRSELSLAPIEIAPLVITAPVVEDIPSPAPIVINAIAVSPIEVPAYDAPPEELAQ
jgi:hypothetical protein